MTNDLRAKQFLPFDALKGLNEALRLKEYEHERSLKCDLSPDILERISNNMMNIDSDSIVEIKYFYDGYYKNIKGHVKIDYIKKELIINDIKISFDDIFDFIIL